MRGQLVGLGLLTLGLSLLLPSGRAHAFGFMEDADPANQAATNAKLNVASTQPNFAPGAPFTPPAGSSAVLNDPFVIQQFDSAKISAPPGYVAVLAEVVISLKYEFDNGIQMAFISPSTSTVSAQGIINLNIGTAAVTTLFPDVVGSPTFSTSKTLTYDPNAAPNTPNTITTPSFTQAVAPLVSSTSATAYFDSAHLAPFVGTGKVDLPVYATATSSYTNSSGNGGGGVITTASASLSVQYYYTFITVPEPSSVVLVGIGTLGMGVVGFRNRRKVGTLAP